MGRVGVKRQIQPIIGYALKYRDLSGFLAIFVFCKKLISRHLKIDDFPHLPGVNTWKVLVFCQS